MKVRLTLGEKLKDLRTEKGLTLADVFEATNISTSTLQRMESDEDTRVGYQDIASLARFYEVSADYLFGLTDNRQYRDAQMDELRLSDEAISALKSETLNNRLISEMISHEDFLPLLNAIEIFLDRKVMGQMHTMNAMYKFAEQTIRENVDIEGRDEVTMVLEQAVIEEDEYLLYRISQRFVSLMKSMFDDHKKDKLPTEYEGMLTDMKRQMQSYLDLKNHQGSERARLAFWAKQLELNITQLTDEELVVLIKALSKSKILKRLKNRK